MRSDMRAPIVFSSIWEKSERRQLPDDSLHSMGGSPRLGFLFARLFEAFDSGAADHVPHRLL